MDAIVTKEICLTSPTYPGGSRSDPIFASQEELEYAKRIILERRRLEQLQAKHALTNPSITDPNSQTPTNQGKIKEETTNDIDSVIRRAPFPSLLRAVEGNETQSNKDDAGRDEYHRSGYTAEQETPRSPRNERGTPQNEYGTMEYSPGATAPSNDIPRETRAPKGFLGTLTRVVKSTTRPWDYY